MLVRVFTLGFDPATERFDDEPVRDFLADKEVVSISGHFFVCDAAPHLVLVVRYRPSASAVQTTDNGSFEKRSSILVLTLSSVQHWSVPPGTD